MKRTTPIARPLAQHLYDCLMMDTWPRESARVDWALDSPRHLGALQAAVKRGATAADLDRVCGDGRAIEALIRDHIDRCHHWDVEFFPTMYDMMDQDQPEEAETIIREMWRLPKSAHLARPYAESNAKTFRDRVHDIAGRIDL